MEEKVSRGEQRLEAYTRMKMLKLASPVLRDFARDKIYYSERQSMIFDGILYYVDNEEKYVKLIKDFETEYHAFVYHAQLTHTNMGDMLMLLFVSQYRNEWEKDRKMLERNETLAYVCNLDAPECSELGMCGVKPKNGGVTRVY